MPDVNSIRPPQQFPVRSLQRHEAQSIPRFFQYAVLLFIVCTGTLPVLLQAFLNGVTGPSDSFVTAVISGLVYDLLRVAPLIALARHRAGILHPMIIAVILWPLLLQLPNIVSDLGGFAGLLSGEVLRPPFYLALAWRNSESGWSDLTQYNLVAILSLLVLYTGYWLAQAREMAPLKMLAEIDTLRLRTILIGIIIANFVAVAAFIQYRGGLIEHIAELAFGRFRALEGLGPLLALFDIGFFALLAWISYRPQDSRSPLFMALLLGVTFQQFIVMGSRAATFSVLIVCGLAWSIAMRRIPWRLALIMLPAALLAVGGLNLVRSSGLTGDTAVEAVQDASFAEVVERSQAELDNRQVLAGSVPVVADGMRTTGPMLGYTYAGAVFAMVPRAVWPDKPRGPGSIYAQRFLGESREGMAVPISAAAEAFWNFHVPGVVLIFALYGWLLRRVYDFQRANPGHGMVIVLFLVFTTQFGVSTDQMVQFQQSAITLALLLGVLFLFYPSTFRGSGRVGTGPSSDSAISPASR
jgi:hypothetical protein